MESKEPFYVLGLIDFMDIATFILDFAPTEKELKEDEKKSTEEAIISLKKRNSLSSYEQIRFRSMLTRFNKL